MRFKALLRHCVPAILCSVALGSSMPARAQEGQSYTISGEDGYGIIDCMHSGSECGRVIADSWCESHGHAHTLAFGTGGDVTGSISAGDAVVKVADNDVVIRCGD